jgi:hypothetical protein
MLLNSIRGLPSFSSAWPGLNTRRKSPFGVPTHPARLKRPDLALLHSTRDDFSNRNDWLNRLPTKRRVVQRKTFTKTNRMSFFDGKGTVYDALGQTLVTCATQY